jgi:hypothetical protein
MKLKASPLVESEFEGGRADIVEFSFGPSGLRIVVSFLDEDSDLYQEIVFPEVRGFRSLDEGDLVPYWKSGVFSNSRHSVFEIASGGWMEQEIQTPGMLATTHAVGWYREWFVVSMDQCVNVIAKDPPLIRRL